MLVICRSAKYRAELGTLGFAHFVFLVAFLGNGLLQFDQLGNRVRRSSLTWAKNYQQIMVNIDEVNRNFINICLTKLVLEYRFTPASLKDSGSHRDLLQRRYWDTENTSED